MGRLNWWPALLCSVGAGAGCDGGGRALCRSPIRRSADRFRGRAQRRRGRDAGAAGADGLAVLSLHATSRKSAAGVHEASRDDGRRQPTDEQHGGGDGQAATRRGSRGRRTGQAVDLHAGQRAEPGRRRGPGHQVGAGGRDAANVAAAARRRRRDEGDCGGPSRDRQLRQLARRDGRCAAPQQYAARLKGLPGGRCVPHVGAHGTMCR
eukprot:6165057-Prymnesium_polylepis.2